MFIEKVHFYRKIVNGLALTKIKLKHVRASYHIGRLGSLIGAMERMLTAPRVQGAK